MNAKSTREHLLDVGVELMHQNGYNATGLSDILKAADLPKGSFYPHFSSKEDFAAAALARYVTHEGEHAARVLDDLTMPPLKRLKRYFTDLTMSYGQMGEIPGCMMGRFSLEMAAKSPQLRKLISASFAGWQHKIAAVVQEAVEQVEKSGSKYCLLGGSPDGFGPRACSPFCSSSGCFYQIQVLQLKRQFNAALEARVDERTRIVRELHDTLLQSFQAVMLKLYSMRSVVGPAEARQKFDALLEQGQQAITEGRDAVQGMRSSTIVKNNLARALGTLAEGLVAEQSACSPVEFSVAVQGETKDLHPILRDEVYRIASEAIRNAFRHSGAQRIEIEINCEDRQLGVSILDNGRGIDPKVLDRGGREGHYGLTGMHERAKLAGGKLTVWSKLGSGTKIELIIPGTRAYIRSSTRQSMS